MRNVAGIVVGDSFGNAGSSNDTQLAAQLGRSMGCRFYNAASEREEIQAPAPERIADLARHVGMRAGLVVVERLERLRLHRNSGPGTTMAAFGRAPSLLDRLWAWARVSPGQLLGEAAFKRLSNDRILPNTYRQSVVEKTLSNGDWMLFYADAMRDYEAHRPVSIEYWNRLRVELAPASLRTFVVLVPNKYAVYYHHLADATPTKVAPEEYLTATEAALREAGVPVVNLTAALQREATEALRRREYVYYRDRYALE